MDSSKMKILELLQNGVITYEEALKLLEILNQNESFIDYFDTEKVKEKAKEIKNNLNYETKTFVEDLKQLGKEINNSKDKLVLTIESSEDLQKAKEKLLNFSSQVSKSIDSGIIEVFDSLKKVFEE